MNYKYLSKYHYIYRLSFHADYTAHIEKIPIAYANKTYVYVIEPGNPELRRLYLTSTVPHGHGDIYTEVNDEITKKISIRLNSTKYSNTQISCWFLVDNLEPLKKLIEEFRHKTLNKLCLEKERDDLVLSVRNMKFWLDKRTEELESINRKLAELNKLKFS